MNILIIEDYKSVGEIIHSVLSAYDFKVNYIKSDQFNISLNNLTQYNLLILNIDLNKGRKDEILAYTRDWENSIHILGISTKGDWKKRVQFLNNGGDDVLNYPFPIQELIARINNLTKRTKIINKPIIRFKNLEIDTDMKHVTKDNIEVPLRRREYNLLEYMIRNRNRTVSREELLDRVWDYRKSHSSNTIDVHIKRLRDKLKDRNFISTIHGFGYSVTEKDKPKAS